jgi:hypothetical protein
MDEPFRTLYVDPGETTGWALGKGLLLLASGQEDMWPFADDVLAACEDPTAATPLAVGAIPDLRQSVDPSLNLGPIGRIVCEDWRLYPWELRNMKWDPCRTARLIGALTLVTRRFSLELVLQPAAIKSTADRTGVEELFDRPLHENRHANDAKRHFAYYTQTELLGVPTVKVTA